MGEQLPENRTSKVKSPTDFSEALSKIVAIPRAEMQKRIATVPAVPVSRHTRYKYVPAKPLPNS
jgi:hypothetical protein